ncbi:MAG TPA: type II toxin-antitoxin system VapC family toxin [Rhodanobacteraceae bacterium]|nr:type II toxin-antitoxin system VapC family toxin [Rhodanobacteraceae bacterium]
MYLLDTNVVSELRKQHADQRVKAWAQEVPPPSLFLSAITVLELETGILQMERRDKKQGAALRNWLDKQVLPAFAERVLPVDLVVALRCARLYVLDRMADGDALIAATALVHGLVVVTRNTSDFEPAGVRLFDPWQA